MKLLEIHELDHFFGGLHVVSKVSFGLESGQIKAVIGPNGAGKTTLFNLISGFIHPLSGRIFYRGEEITRLQPYQIARKGIVRTFQNIRLSRHMSVLENVMLGHSNSGQAGFVSSILRLPAARLEEKSIHDTALEALETLDIAGYRDSTATSLPFGIQRRVEFARALACKPSLLLLDEPASGLNMHETRETAQLIRQIRDKGVTVLIVEHDMGLVMDISDEIAVLNFGRLIAEGDARSIQRNSEVIRVYLGDEDA